MKKKTVQIISKIIGIIFILTLSLFTYFVFVLDIIPYKYLITFYTLFILTGSILLFNIFSKKKRKVRNKSAFVLGLMTIMLIVANVYLNNTYSFLLSSLVGKHEILNYSVVVLKGEYKTLKALNNKDLAYLEDNYQEEVSTYLLKKIKYNEKLYDNTNSLGEDLLAKKVKAIVIEEGHLSLLKEEIEEFREKIVVIHRFKVKVKSFKENPDVNVATDSFIVYISGIDNYGNITTTRGRSDVNIIAIVNPKTHKILLVNTPRDYYIQLSGTKGPKDKLTHAGIYGIGMSVKTLEEFYNIDIDYYLRVNFNTLVRIVDLIGGIEIVSDHSFVPWTNKKITIKKGLNKMNGEMALAYSRERYAYVTGDHQRGANQQQVITAIINKLGTSRVLLNKYNSILNSLNGTFQTSMDMKDITSLIRKQLESMPKWEVESIAVEGYNHFDITYSMGNRVLYVMLPHEESIRNAKNRMKEVYEEK